MKKLHGKPIKFARWGGLSPVKQRGYDPSMPTFHSPPARKGIYAFVWPYIDIFLLTGDFANNHKWKKTGKILTYPGTDYTEPETKLHKCRQFTYTGDLWHHLGESVFGANILQIKGSWCLTTFDDYVTALGKELHKMKVGHKYDKKSPLSGMSTNNPTFGWCKDHLEVFIEKP